jgi:hypothetical protein
MNILPPQSCIPDGVYFPVFDSSNYPGVQHDTTFGMDTLDPLYPNNSTLLNTAFYHRSFRHDKKGAMGMSETSMIKCCVQKCAVIRI